MAWAGRHSLVDAVLPPAGPVMSSEPVLGGAEGLSPSAKVIWDLARVYLSQNPALSSAPMAGAAIGVPGGAARTIPRPQPVDLRKLANDYARFVMGKASAPLVEPDPRIIKELTSLGQRAAGGTEMVYPPPLAYQGAIPVPPSTTLPVRSTTEHLGVGDAVPRIHTGFAGGSYPILSLRSMAWPSQPPTTASRLELLTRLEELMQQGLWP